MGSKTFVYFTVTFMSERNIVYKQHCANTVSVLSAAKYRGSNNGRQEGECWHKPEKSDGAQQKSRVLV